MARPEPGTTGTRLSLRRYSNCNLHWYGPRSHPFSARGPHQNLPRRIARQRLYIPEEHHYPGSKKYGRDRFGPYVWVGTDCGWEWLATRPGVQYTPLYLLFDRLHDHVHTAHRPDRTYVFQPVKRMLVRLTGSRVLDTRLGTDVFPGSNTYRIQVRFDELSEHQKLALIAQIVSRDGPVDFHATTQHGQTLVRWDELASNPTLAMRQAQALAKAARIGGGFWETPELVTLDTPPVYNIPEQRIH